MDHCPGERRGSVETFDGQFDTTAPGNWPLAARATEGHGVARPGTGRNSFFLQTGDKFGQISSAGAGQSLTGVRAAAVHQLLKLLLSLEHLEQGALV